MLKMRWEYPDEDELLHSIISTYGGECSDNEYEILWKLAKQYGRNGYILEIGAKFGISTLILANASKLVDGCKVISVDASTLEMDRSFLYVPKTDLLITGWTRFLHYYKNLYLYDLYDHVISINAKSQEIADILDCFISLLFIDGAHDYESVKQDWIKYSPKVISGGIVIFHDYIAPVDVKKVIDGYVKPNPQFVYCEEYSEDSLYVVKKS
tara:strand:- start:4823 stop:5455 length:633 start_codon:yes stop_codon:yes gene_type:complete